MGLKAVISRQMKLAIKMTDAQGRGHEKYQALYLLAKHVREKESLNTKGFWHTCIAIC
jgi:hypothetical protein